MKILAISWASHTSVNRQIFRSLAKQDGVIIKVIIPKKINISGVCVKCDSFTNEEISIVSLDVTGDNPRYNRYINVHDFLQDFNPDVVYHEDDPISIQAVQYGVWCYLNRKKFICRTNQNTIIEYKSEIRRLGSLKGVIYTTLKLSLYKTSRNFIDHIFAISNDGVRIYKNFGYNNVSKIPLGVDESIFKINNHSRETVRNELGINGMVFSYIGRMIKGKGLHVLLEALSKIKQYRWTLLLDSFEMHTKSDYHHRINKHIDQWALKDRIILFEADHNEISNYMNASDVVVVPSITTSNFKEQYGRVAPESMACGCLVIASNSGTLPELVAESGWLFEEGNVNELSSLLIKAINLNGKDSIRCNASKYVHKNLSIEAQTKAMMGVLKRL
jgi:glycosyltransferase involved in cell wall biosynthesis